MTFYWINCSSDLKKISRTPEYFFLTVGQNNFGNKIPVITKPGLSQSRAPPVFGRSVNPISTGGAHYAYHITMCHQRAPPPDFKPLRRPCYEYLNSEWIMLQKQTIPHLKALILSHFEPEGQVCTLYIVRDVSLEAVLGFWFRRRWYW